MTVSRPRVLFVSAEPIGEKMAGPSIRTLELAREVARHCRVTLAAPAPSAVDDAGLQFIETGIADFPRLLEELRAHDVVVAERLSLQLLRYVVQLPIRYVVDMNNPGIVETLEAANERSPRAQRRIQSVVAGLTVANCAAADFMVCGSEKARDLWLGVLAGQGLLDLESYELDKTGRSIIDVVPFGLPDEPPPPADPIVKGVWPGIAAGDRVLVWGGGIWNWLDPITVIRAVERLGDADPPVHAFFPAVKRPVRDVTTRMTAADRAAEYARDRGLEGRRVHFNPEWMPYEERGRYLLGSDLGVSAHFDHLETRFSFRTRILDYLWAGLPVVTTKGDTLGDLVESRGLGSTVDFEDDAGFAAACLELLDDRERHERCTREIERVAPSFRWSEVAQPLVRYCVEFRDRPPRPKHRAFLLRVSLGLYPDVLAHAYETYGAAELGRKVVRNVWRALSARA